MEARFARAIPAVALLIGLTTYSVCSTNAYAAAGYRTTNFVVSAPTPQLAKEIGDTAEECRKRLAIEWLGKEMPPWARPCPIHAQLASGAGGATSFVFNRGEVYDWKMNIQGSRERILDSVLPHEVTHTIFNRISPNLACARPEMPTQRDSFLVQRSENTAETWRQLLGKKTVDQDTIRS